MSLQIASNDHYIYISNDGKDSNDGTYDKPLNGSNFIKIRESINQLSPESTDHTHLVFKEGMYFSDGWSIMGWDYDKNRIQKLTIEGEENKNVIIYSSKKITGWTKSEKYQNLWFTNFPDSIYQLFIGDNRATLCRLPEKWKYARPYGYEVHDDPSDSKYYLRYLYVQEDCIKILQQMTKEELQQSELVIHYWWYTDIRKIIDFNSEKHYIITKILKEEELEQTISCSSYYYIQGAFPSITSPGEYYHHSNGTLYYYPREGEDMKYFDVYSPIQEKDFRSIQFNDVLNLTIKNLKFYYTDYGIGGINFNNLLIYNCEFRHVKTAFAVLGADNSVVDHCFIEDTSRSGCAFSGNYFTFQNCIIRNVGVVAPFGFAVDFWSGNNHTFILNNDISDGTTSLIFFGANVEYNVEEEKNVLIENNHLHHGGYGIVDDLASMFFGRHPRGVVVNHNKIHDFYTNNYCGNGIYPDTGSSGTKVSNNLVYNLSHSGFNLNFGKEHEVYNNIMAFCRAGFSFGGYQTDSYTLNIHNNIVYLDRDESYPVEGPVLNDDVTNYFDKNIYYKTGNRDITINGLSFEQWQERNNDKNSLIIDPLFTDPEHGDFSFKSKENINKIDFNEFNMTFGVIGDEWRKKAENYTYHDPVKRTHEHPIIGFESFENGEESYFFKRMNYNKNPIGISVGITEEKSFSGKHSFKIQHINEESSYYSFNFPTFFRNGTAEFTMMLFVNDESDFIFDFGLGGWIFMKDGILRYACALGDILGSYPSNEWFKFGFRADVGEFNQMKYTLIINDNKTIYNVTNEKFEFVDYIIITSNGKGTAYFDDFNSTINQYVEPYFADCLKFDGGKPNDGDNSSNDKKGLKSGQIAGIVIGVIAFITIVLIVVLFIVKKKKSDLQNSLHSSII